MDRFAQWFLPSEATVANLQLCLPLTNLQAQHQMVLVERFSCSLGPLPTWKLTDRLQIHPQRAFFHFILSGMQQDFYRNRAHTEQRAPSLLAVRRGGKK